MTFIYFEHDLSIHILFGDHCTSVVFLIPLMPFHLPPCTFFCVCVCVLPLCVGTTGLGGKTEEAPNTNKRVRLSLCLSRAPELALWDNRERLNNWKISLPPIPERSLYFSLSLSPSSACTMRYCSHFAS